MNLLSMKEKREYNGHEGIMPYLVWMCLAKIIGDDLNRPLPPRYGDDMSNAVRLGSLRCPG